MSTPQQRFDTRDISPLEKLMNSDRMTVLPGPLEHNEINDLECQPGVTTHTEPKGRIGEVSTPLVELLGWGVRLNLTYAQFGSLRAVVAYTYDQLGDKLDTLKPVAAAFDEAHSIIASMSTG